MKHFMRRVINHLLSRINRKLIRLDDNRIIKVDYPYFPKPRSWAETAGIQRIKEQMSRGESGFADMLLSFSGFIDKFEAIPVYSTIDDESPRWINGWLPGLDAASIYGLLATRNPSLYFEVGSGNSTKFARKAIRDNGLRTRIISVDPQPRADIDSLCDEVIRSACEDVPISMFENLPADMIFFVDNSHRSFQNSDVTVFFSEILPLLPGGCVWGLHDIELPNDYSPEITDRYYNEQYLLLAYLLGGGGNDTILLPNAFISNHPRLSSIVNDTFFAGSYFTEVEKHGCCFWMLRGEKAYVQ
jgi:hypothetical protein